MMEPPKYLVDIAIIEGQRSPCAKSKRGAVIYDEKNRGINRGIGGVVRGVELDFALIAMGHNHLPAEMPCDGSSGCRANCAKACLHAEQDAIHHLPQRYMRGLTMRRRTNRVHDLRLIHVKVADGQLVPGGGPSCWQCSRLCLEFGISVWLYEAQRWHDELTCDACGRITVVEQGGGTTGVCEKCKLLGGLLSRDQRIYDLGSGAWKLYSPHAFHAETAVRCGIYLAGVQ